MKNIFSCLLFLSLLSLCSCNLFQNKDSIIPSKYRQILNRADEVIQFNPLASIHLTDSLLKDSLFSERNELVLVKLYQIREKAYYKLNKGDSVLENAEKIRFNASIVGDSTAIFESLKTMYSVGADYEIINNAGKFYPGAIIYFQKKGDKYNQGVISALNGIYLESKEDFKGAIKSFLVAYDLFDKIDSLRSKGRACNSIGNVYSRINSIQESNKYHQMALEIAEKINNVGLITSALMNMGINYRHTNPDSALFFYRKSLSKLPKTGMERFEVKLQYNIANLYLDKKELDSAIAMFVNVLNVSKSSRMYEGIGMANAGIAGVYLEKKDLNNAAMYYKRAIANFDSIGQTQSSIVLMPNLMEVYKIKGDLKNALEISQKINKLNDSLLTSDKIIAVHKLELGFQNEKKEIENLNLKKDLNVKRTSIGVLLVIAILLFVLYRQRSVLLKDRTIAYHALIEQYIKEKNQRENSFGDKSKEGKIDNNISINSSTVVIPLFDKIVAYYEKEKPHLNPKLKISDLADVFNTTQREISEVLNSKAGCNFSVFTNRYRVQEARRLFENPNFIQLKMDVIAAKSGFGTIQSFYNAFELNTGVKPAFYRTHINNLK